MVRYTEHSTLKAQYDWKKALQHVSLLNNIENIKTLKMYMYIDKDGLMA